MFNLYHKYKDFFQIGDSNKLTESEITDIKAIKDFIVDFYETLKLDFDFEKRSIYKTNIGHPKFVPKNMNKNLEEEYILLSISKYSYWCKVIYQLSHEITHCFINCHNKNNNCKIKWVEETICEAMSLYFLKTFYTKWDNCFLYKINKTYSPYILEYLEDILKDNGNNKLFNCKNTSELEVINTKADINREYRLNEMKELYYKINDEDIVGLIKYRDYAYQNTCLLNTKQYRKDFQSNKAVSFLCDIQEKIIYQQKQL